MAKRDWLKITKETREQMQDEQAALEAQSSPEPILAQETLIVEKARKGRPKKVKEVKLVGKSADPDFTQVSVYIREETHNDAKIKLIREGKKRDFSDLVQDLLDAWVKK